jgi:Flp pilus assembly protein CpaB
MPKDYIPPNALTTLEGTENMLAAGPIPQNTVIHPDLLITPVQLMQEGELGKLVEPGFVGVAFPIDELSSVSYGIKPGDHVDVMMTFFFIDIDQETQIKEPLCAPLCPTGAGEESGATSTDQRPRPAAQLTLQDIEVLGVGRWVKEEVPPEQQDNQARAGEPVPVELPRYITLMVSPQDALVLKLAREDNASIDLAVRAKDDGQEFTTQQVTLDYIMARFGVGLPAKQPYSLNAIGNIRPQPEQ